LTIGPAESVIVERKLAAILAADVFGYSRLMGDDEEATLRTLTSHRTLIDSLIAEHHGRFVKCGISSAERIRCASHAPTIHATVNAAPSPTLTTRGSICVSRSFTEVIRYQSPFWLNLVKPDISVDGRLATDIRPR
jgi:hypothetical protein